jgi:hypothetical protein
LVSFALNGLEALQSFESGMWHASGKTLGFLEQPHNEEHSTFSVRRIYEMPWFTIGGSKLMAV